MRRSGDERELEKIVSAFERAERDLERAEAEVKDALAKRSDVHSAAAAEYLDESADFARASEKVEREIADAQLRRDRARAAVKGLGERGLAVSQTVAAAKVERAEKRLSEAEKQHERVVREAERDLFEAQTQLAQMKHEQAAGAWMFNGGSSPGDVDAMKVDVFVNHGRGIDQIEQHIPPRLRQRVEAGWSERERERERVEAERKRAREKKARPANALLPGEDFPRLGGF